LGAAGRTALQRSPRTGRHALPGIDNASGKAMAAPPSVARGQEMESPHLLDASALSLRTRGLNEASPERAMEGVPYGGRCALTGAGRTSLLGWVCAGGLLRTAPADRGRGLHCGHSPVRLREHSSAGGQAFGSGEKARTAFS